MIPEWNHPRLKPAASNGTAHGANLRLLSSEFAPQQRQFVLGGLVDEALGERFAVCRACLSEQARLHGRSGQAKTLYRTLMRSLTTFDSPQADSLESVLQRFASISAASGIALRREPTRFQYALRGALTEYSGGYAFADVLAKFLHDDSASGASRKCALEWLRGNIQSKRDAYEKLGVRTAILDSEVYSQLKLLAALLRLTGYSGLTVLLEVDGILDLRRGWERETNMLKLNFVIRDLLLRPSPGFHVVLCATPIFWAHVEEWRRSL